MGEEIDGIVIDAIKEISNIAAGHLSEIISQLTQKEMSISVPNAEIIRVNDAADRIGGKGASILVGYMNVFGDVSGSLVFLLPKKDAVKLSELTLNADVSPLMFPSPLEKDALRELITITGGAYLSAITQFLGIYFVPTAPIISLFGAFNLLNFLKTRTGAMEEYEARTIVLVSIKYKVSGTDVTGEILMLVGPTILDYVGKELKEKFSWIDTA
jgi:chemotaxis protein CheC